MSASFSSPALYVGCLANRSLPLVEVDLGDLEHDVGEASPDTLDRVDGEHNFAFTVDVGVLDSENVGELLSFHKVNR